MKNLISSSTFLLMILLNLVSCQSDLIQENGQNELKTKSEPFSIHVIYEEKDYYSLGYSLEDSLIIENQELKSMIDNIFTNNNAVQTYLHPDGTIEYFDNKEMLQNKYPLKDVNIDSINKMDTPKTKSNYYDQFDGYALMYDNVNFEGTMQDAVNMYNRVPQKFTIAYELFQKISSIEIHCKKVLPNVNSVLECYDQTASKGNCLLLTTMWFMRFDLNKIPCGKGTWNDRICRVSFSVKEYQPFP